MDRRLDALALSMRYYVPLNQQFNVQGDHLLKHVAPLKQLAKDIGYSYAPSAKPIIVYLLCVNPNLGIQLWKANQAGALFGVTELGSRQLCVNEKLTGQNNTLVTTLVHELAHALTPPKPEEKDLMSLKMVQSQECVAYCTQLLVVDALGGSAFDAAMKGLYSYRIHPGIIEECEREILSASERIEAAARRY